VIGLTQPSFGPSGCTKDLSQRDTSLQPKG
jgi:hypothetical protein